MTDPISPEQLLARLRWRYATKQFDPNRKISPEVWAALEEALILSPSSGGLQPRKFVVVTDPAVRQKLLPASFGQAQVTEASHLVVFAAKTDISVADVDAHISRTANTRGVSVESLGSFRQMLVGGIVESKDQSGPSGMGGPSGIHRAWQPADECRLAGHRRLSDGRLPARAVRRHSRPR